MRIWLPFIITFIVVSVLAFSTMFVFRNVWKTESKPRIFFQNLSLTIFSILYVFLILEFVFGLFVAQSDGYAFTLSSQRWFQKYWNPINSQGYRDYDHDWKKNILFVVGDSFVAGHGIKHIDDRLAGVLAKRLGNTWTVAVIAQNGWDSVQEYDALVKHPKKPKTIIVSYFINDIESAATVNGFPRPQLIRKPDGIIRPFVDNSFAINWFYWRSYRGGVGNTYWNYLQQAYNNAKIWDSHTSELRNFISYSRQIESEIIFIIWPNLKDLEGSFEFTSRVSDYLAEQKVKSIDLTKYFLGRDSRDIVVNAMDVHPNVQANKEVAELVYQSLFSRK